MANKARNASDSALEDKLGKEGPPNHIRAGKTNSVGALDALDRESDWSKTGVKAKYRVESAKRSEDSIRSSLANLVSKAQEIGLPRIVMSEDGNKFEEALVDAEFYLDTIERKEIIEKQEVDKLLEKEDGETDDGEYDEDLLSGNLDEVEIEHKENAKRKLEEDEGRVKKKRCTPSVSSMKDGHSGANKYDIEEELDDVFEDNNEEKAFIFPQKRRSSGYGSSARSSGHKAQTETSTIELDESEAEIMGVPRHVKDEVLTEEDEESEDGM